jgi:hypothetical protein
MGMKSEANLLQLVKHLAHVIFLLVNKIASFHKTLMFHTLVIF